MPQIYVAPEQLTATSFALTEKEAHHVMRVLRKKVGDELNLFDGKGGRFLGRIDVVDTGANQVQGTITKTLPAQDKSVSICLMQGLPRGQKFDFVVEKAVELGVDRLVPFVSEKNPVKAAEGPSTKSDRWNRLAEAASKQCGRSSLPTVDPVRKIKDLEADFTDATSFVFSTAPGTPGFRKIFTEISSEMRRKINVIIGPESGFSPAELKWLISEGAIPVSLGNSVFRTETAGLVAVSLVNYELGLL